MSFRRLRLQFKGYACLAIGVLAGTMFGASFATKLMLPVAAGMFGLAALSIAALWHARAQRLQAQFLSAELARFEQLEAHTDDMVTRSCRKGTVHYATPSLERVLGYPLSEIVGSSIIKLLHPEDHARWKPALKAAARERKPLLLEGRWLRKDGTYVHLESSMRFVFNEEGRVTECISVGRNIDARKALEQRLEAAAQTDFLTGLPNRAALVGALSQLSKTKPFALFLFDLDRFKQVNDSLGHAAGDDYLVETARRARDVLRPEDMLARIGGDEFVALLHGPEHEQAQAIATRIVEAVRQPFLCRGTLLHPKTSIGIAFHDGMEDVEADELISRADRAMYEAKRQGGNAASVFEGDDGESKEDFAIEQQLATAEAEGRFLVHYQTIVEAKTKSPALAEALVRMRGTDGSLVPPDKFIPVAEKTDIIISLGAWVLRQACQHANRLAALGKPLTISVNVSPRQLLHVGYVESVREVLASTGVRPQSIVLEVTESAVMEDVAKARTALVQLRELGLKLALDDFGTGYSSISVLKDLPFDILKIDRAFVPEAEKQTVGASILAAIIDIGKSQNLTILAEGIETAIQSTGLERLGCDLLQGYFYHRPVAADEHLQACAHVVELPGAKLVESQGDVALFA